MYRSIVGMRLPFKVLSQFPLGPYRTDFAIPMLKLAIECDGEYWHRNPEALAKDKKRDQELSQHGWTVIRFAERDLEENMRSVEYTLSTVIHDLWKTNFEKQKQMQQKAQGSFVGRIVTSNTSQFEDEELKSLTNQSLPIAGEMPNGEAN
jgi:very-short-patch-repair endonuclease